jgi:hypothetical protein
MGDGGKHTGTGASGDEGAPRGSCVKGLVLLCLLSLILYMGIHVYFVWQPAGGPDALTEEVMKAELAGVKVFPAVQAYPMAHIAGRVEILEGRSMPAPMLKQRLAQAVQRQYPVTFREEEINAWLGKRLDVRQGGSLAPMVKVRGVWVDFKKNQIELIIERELHGKQVHVTSLFMGFERSRQGYVISRHSCQIGQVRLPGGFARLVLPAFNNLLDELADEMAPYYDEKIYDVRVEDGKITFDPRRPEHRL